MPDDEAVPQLPRLTYAGISRALNDCLFEQQGEWAGLPMPLPGCGLVVESRHPRAADIATIQAIIDADPDEAPAPEEGPRITPINEWYSLPRHEHIVIYRDDAGRTRWFRERDGCHRNTTFWFGPFKAFEAWDLDRELTAMRLLETLVSERMYAAYVLTGTFLESSPRSRVSYLFRRLRPTLALSSRNEEPTDLGMRILCALCLHPIAYYAATFCGAMVPTDDVIAHLLMMRADERMFWRRSNQHPAWVLEAGL